MRSWGRNVWLALMYLRQRMGFALTTALGSALAFALVASVLSLSALGMEAAQARVQASGFDVLQVEFHVSERLARLPWHPRALADVRQAVPTARELAPFSVGEAPVYDGNRTRWMQVVASGRDDATYALAAGVPDLRSGAAGADDRCLVDASQAVRRSTRTVLPAGLTLRPAGQFAIAGALLFALTDQRPALWVSGRSFDALSPGNPRHFLHVRLNTSDYDGVMQGLARTRTYFEQRYPSLQAKVSTPWEPLREQKRTFDMLRRVAAFMGLAIAALAALAMGHAVAVSLHNRRLEIGIRLSIGALPTDVAMQVALETTLLSLLGVMLGSALALLTTYLWCLYAGWQWRPVMDALGLCAGIALLSGVAAGTVPAWSAARMDPSEVLRR